MPKGFYGERKFYDRDKSSQAREFRGVDGEGGNVPESGTLFPEIVRHQYLSLRVGPHLLETGMPLQWWEIFKFLTDQDWRFNYVSYFFDYDVTMIVRTMPVERARRLLYRGLRTRTNVSRPLDIRAPDGTEYQCDYLPHKEFKVRRVGQQHWIIISDTGQFFQGSFLNTLKKWNIGTPEEQEMIKTGKEQRAHFTYHDAEIQAYNALECVLLEQLMTDFREVCYQTGYIPKKWQGPGNLAAAMLTKHGVPRRDQIPILGNPDFKQLAQSAYYGGRFEITAAGPIPVRTHQYDINGAYVHMLKSLPCLIHGSWDRVFERPNSGLWFGEVYFDHDAPRRLYNLPFRLSNGNIRYPKEGNGCYWNVELEAAERAGTHFEVRNAWVYKAACECKWFDWIDDYYAERIKLGKSDKGYVLKLAGNSIYGKIAQSIGYAPWANSVWAGLITAGCRAQLVNAYAGHENDCYMLATDGLFMGCKLDLPVSKSLGEWDYTEHPDGIFIIQPGLYFMGGEAKSRGVEKGIINTLRGDFEVAFKEFVKSHGHRHTVKVPITNFITARQALQWGRWEAAGTWQEDTRDITFDWSIKRKSGVGFWENGILRTLPHNGGPDEFSTSYDRIIGGQAGPDEYDQEFMETERERLSSQPDWVMPIFTP